MTHPSVRDGDTWRTLEGLQVRDGGVWKPVKQAWVMDGGNGWREWLPSDSCSNVSAQDNSLDCDTSDPEARTGVNWDEEGLGAAVDRVEVWRDSGSSVGSLSSAVKVGEVTWENAGHGSGTFGEIEPDVDSGTFYHYWVRIRFDDGSHGPYVGPGSTSTCSGSGEV